MGSLTHTDTQGSQKPTEPMLSDGVKPPLASLPYHVLLQVFVYASHPLHDENMAPTASISWLVQMARTCQAFTKPALTALYRNPPIFALKQNRKALVQHLISPPPGAREDYAVMVKRLELDATQMSALTDATHSVTDLASLVSSLKTLKEIDISDPIDKPPYRERLRRARRWYYPDELFTALHESEARLKSWRWNSTFCAQDPLWIKDIHADKAFQSLQDLTLTKFHSDETRKPDDVQPTPEELLGSALAVLPNLRYLTFETCTAVDGRLLPLLPKNLVYLNFTNCRDLISEALQGFLATHGARLEELVLNHDQSLDLAFLVDLKQSCPRLEVLRMDLNYYSSLAMSADNEPLYDYLLGEDEVPTWPSTLRIIDLEYLRNWTSGAATTFFTSLINSAEELPWLREITILAMVDVDWRQRAEFRKKWTATFQKVFARKMTLPAPHLVSLRAYREWKAAQGSKAEKNDSFLDVEPDVAEAPEAENNYSGVPVPTTPRKNNKSDEKWNPKRLRSRPKASTSYDETSDNASDSEEVLDEEVGFVQGRCHTVVFRIDNFRPREEIYDEADFLDAERSGDEDWDGNDVVDDGYAW